MNESHAESVFHAARALEGAQRDAFLDAACGTRGELRAEVEGLLTADQQAAEFLEPAEIGAPLRDHAEGDRIGPYKLLQRIGEGGFGEVWMAEQKQPLQRRVALKIVKLGMDTRRLIARFEAERQALAMMDHPNIARVFDAGSTALGRPFFVMELVRGVSITQYCDDRNLSIAERLALFRDVCRAVQHAHSKGIIHRDLKPTNVLVTMLDGLPTPKVIDFGIAKATQGSLTDRTLFTEFHQLMGTPAYMSPEQVEQSSVDIDTRSDIYSLGVLLYELLTGTTPFTLSDLMAAGIAEFQRVIREEEPAKPSTKLSTSDALPSIAARRHTEPKRLGMLVRGDLDWIVMRCLEKDRQRRYETAGALAEDIGRHLHGELIQAAPPGRVYRARKFVRRHRIGVTAGSLVGAALIVGIVGTSLGMREARRERDRADLHAGEALASAERAERELERAQEAQLFMSEMLGAVTPQVALGRDTTLMREILDAAATRLENGDVEDPLNQAELLVTLGTTYRRLGEYAAADTALRRGLAMYRRLAGDNAKETLTAIYELNTVLQLRGRLAEAEPLIVESLEGFRRLLGAEDRNTLTNLGSLAQLRQAQGDYAAAEALQDEAVQGMRRVLGDDHEETLMAISNHGLILLERGENLRAVECFTEVSERANRVLGPDHPLTLNVLGSLAHMAQLRGDQVAAEAGYSRLLAARRRVNGNDHPSTFIAMNNLAMVQAGALKTAEAEALLREALAGRRRVEGADHPGTCTLMLNLGRVLLQRDELQESHELMLEALECRRRSLGESHPDTSSAKVQLAKSRLARSESTAAEALLREALPELQDRLGPEHYASIDASNELGRLLLETGRVKEAEPLLRAKLDFDRANYGPEHISTLKASRSLSRAWFAMGRAAEAFELFRSTAAAARAGASDSHRLMLEQLLGDEGELRLASKDSSGAQVCYAELYDLRCARLGDSHERSRQCAEKLAEIFDALEAGESGLGHAETATHWRDRAAKRD